MLVPGGQGNGCPGVAHILHGEGAEWGALLQGREDLEVEALPEDEVQEGLPLRAQVVPCARGRDCPVPCAGYPISVHRLGRCPSRSVRERGSELVFEGWDDAVAMAPLVEPAVAHQELLPEGAEPGLDPLQVLEVL